MDNTFQVQLNLRGLIHPIRGFSFLHLFRFLKVFFLKKTPLLKASLDINKNYGDLNLHGGQD